MPGSTLAAQGRRLPEGQGRSSLTVSHVTFDRIFEGTREDDNYNDLKGGRTQVLLELDLQLSTHVRLDLVLPYQFGTFDTIVGITPTTFDRDGAQDVSGTFVWTPWGEGPCTDELWSLSNVLLCAGIKLPTGHVSNDGTDDAPVKLGTGSTDFILGAAYGMKALPTLDLYASFFATVNGPEREPETPFSQFIVSGNQYRARAGANWQAAEWLSVALSVEADVRDRTRINGTTFAVSGGTTWSVSAGASTRVTDGVYLFASVGMPVHRDVNGRQIVTNETWSFGFSWWF